MAAEPQNPAEEAPSLPEEIEERIDRGDYAGALAALESLRDEIPERGELRAELLYRIGYCRLHLGRYGEAQEALLAARAADEAGHFRFRISVALANLMLRSGRYADAATLLRGLLAEGGCEGDEETLLHYSLGQAEFYLGELKEAIGDFRKALAHYRKTKSPRGIVSTLQSLAAAHQLRHEVEPATEAYLEAFELAKKQEDWQSVGLIYLNLGALYQDRGHFINAEHYFDQALAIMRDLGRVPYEVSLLCNLGNLTVRMGLLDEAGNYFREAEKLLSEKPELRQYHGYLHAYRSELHADRGDFDAAAADLKAAQEVFAALKNPKDLALVAEGRMEVATRARDCEGAQAALRTLKGLVDERDEYGRHKLAVMELRAELLGEEPALPARLEKAAERAIGFFQTRGYLSLLWESSAMLGELRLAAGNPGGARESLLRANDAHEEIRRTLPARAQSSYDHRAGVRSFARACHEASLDKSSFVLLKILEFNKKLNEGFGTRGAQEFLTDVLDEAIALVHADDGYLFLGKEVQAARTAERKDADDRAAPPHETIARTLLADVERTGKPALVFSSAADPQSSEELSEMLKELKLVSLLVVPIRARGGVLGTIYLHNRYNRGAFTQENLFLIEAFCDQAGLAIVNSRRLEQALDHEARLSEEVEYLKRELSGGHQLVVGQSRLFQKALRTARKAARSDASVLIRGETGTGKELLAQEVHSVSNRAAAPYVRVNVPAIPAELLESELFGHEAGAFTGARRRKRGLFEIADGGTILLDEIGDLPAPSQVKLLRVLQERRLTRLGGTKEIPLDVRVIAATNRDLEALMHEKLFREDLFYRLNVITIDVPPLRERPEDVLSLAEHFLAHYARQSGKRIEGLSTRAKEALLAYTWPGNVRELENLIQRAVLLEDGKQLELTEAPGLHTATPARGAKSFRKRIQNTQAEAIRDALASTGGNKKQAARLLGLSRSRFYELLGELGVG